jgi:hypothetical protein
MNVTITYINKQTEPIDTFIIDTPNIISISESPLTTDIFIQDCFVSTEIILPLTIENNINHDKQFIEIQFDKQYLIKQNFNQIIKRLQTSLNTIDTNILSKQNQNEIINKYQIQFKKIIQQQELTKQNKT